MTETTRLIIEGVVSVLLIGRGIFSHYEHKKNEKIGKETKATVNDIKIYMNGEFERKLAEEKKKWEEENKK